MSQPKPKCVRFGQFAFQARLRSNTENSINLAENCMKILETTSAAKKFFSSWIMERFYPLNRRRVWFFFSFRSPRMKQTLDFESVIANSIECLNRQFESIFLVADELRENTFTRFSDVSQLDNIVWLMCLIVTLCDYFCSPLLIRFVLIGLNLIPDIT